MRQGSGNHSSGGDPTSRIRGAILVMLAEARGGGGVDPTEVARRLAGLDETEWGRLMKPIRAVAVSLAKEGALVIRRKGGIVDPDDFKGVYRLSPPPAEGG